MGPISSSLCENHFEGDLAEDNRKESNILVEGPEWVERGLIGLKEAEKDVRDELASPDLTLAMGTLVFDQTPVSEIKLVNVAE